MVMGYPGYGEKDHKPKHAKPENVEVEQPLPSPGLGGIDSNIKEAPTVKEKFGIPWKAIYGFLAVFGGQLVARSFVEGVPVFPTNTSGIIALVGGSFVAAVSIYLKNNLYTVSQAENNLAEAKLKAA